MATDAGTIRFLLDQAAGAGAVSARRMFGEYALYCDGKVVALVCGDTLYLKPTPGALALVIDPHFAPPYAGAKPHLQIEDELDDPDLLSRLIRAVCADLPPPAPKRPRKPKAAG
jgi:TfoX/Sxy family transcriptional regulator of competence genes